MQTQDKTIAVTHKKNGIARVFSETQNRLMGAKNRKMFRQATPTEAEASPDLETLTQQTENERLKQMIADLQKQLQEKPQAAPEENTGKTALQLENEGLRAMASQLQADVTTANSSLETSPESTINQEDDSTEDVQGDGVDPNPELTVLRSSYETLTGKKPGRLGIDKLNEAIAAAQKETGNNPVSPS
jgi:hypothetical protein